MGDVAQEIAGLTATVERIVQSTNEQVDLHFTLRQRMTMAALAGRWGDSQGGLEHIADLAVQIADAVIKRLKEPAK